MGEGGNSAGSTPGLTLILPLFLGHLVLPGYTVSACYANSLFLGALHWLAVEADLGHFGVSFLEVLILFEQWAGLRLLSEKVTVPHDRDTSISSVPVSEGIEIRQGCQFISNLVRAVGKLPSGICRFLPCGVGSHMSRSRHSGWEQCYHGLASRPLESCHRQCLQAVCGVLGLSSGCGDGAFGWNT